MKTLAVILIAVLMCSCSPNGKKTGGDRDAHGCIPSAGYTWCEERQECIRVWEEPCVKAEIIKACYECEKLGKVYVDYYKGDGASIVVDGGKFKLDRAIAASGARYTGNDVMIWDKAGKATLEYKGKSYNCTVKE